MFVFVFFTVKKKEKKKVPGFQFNDLEVSLMVSDH